MSIESKLFQRANNRCELCGSSNELKVYEVPESSGDIEDINILICNRCRDQIEDSSTMDVNHWRCLNDSMWSEVPAVQVMAWRMLHRIKSFGWSQDLLDMMYLEDDIHKWAAAAGDAEDKTDAIIHKDVNGVILNAGDSVVLIKDLKVKGSSMVAKQGSAVRRISLDPDNELYIEGKVDGQHIVIITKYVKKI